MEVAELKRYIRASSGTSRNYVYKGRVYIEGEPKKVRRETTAVSDGKALSNIKFKIAEHFGVKLKDVKLDKRFLYSLLAEDELREAYTEPNTCDRCGRRLSDAGYCKVCDDINYDETVKDEEEEKSYD